MNKYNNDMESAYNVIFTIINYGKMHLPKIIFDIIDKNFIKVYKIKVVSYFSIDKQIVHI